MTTEARKIELVSEKILEKPLNVAQKYALLRSHPRRIFLDVAALTWEVYFLWNQNWQAALAIFIGMNTLGFLPVRKTNLDTLAQTTLGKLALLHLQPMNLLVQLTGAVFAVSGLLRHDGLSIMAGVTLIFAGHFYGWSKVHPALQMRE